MKIRSQRYDLVARLVGVWLVGVWLVGVCCCGTLFAQENDPERTLEAEKKQEQALTESSLTDLPDYKGDDQGQEKSPAPEVIAEIETKIKELEGHDKLSSDEKVALVRLKNELKLAKIIRQQFKRAKPPKVARSADDTYVLAKLEVLPNAQVLDIRFESIEGELKGVQNVVNYMRETPANGFRDYRIIGRHANGSEAETALYEVRQDYDAAKAQQEQYLRYIAQRQADLARIAAARRC